MKLFIPTLLTGLIVFALSFNPAAQTAAEVVADSFDQRPIEKILIIGNSCTYYHQMPYMIRQMAISAGMKQHVEITLQAWGGASFEENWKSADVQRLLQRHWDQVILQSESRAQTNEANAESFSNYGSKLIAAAQATHSPVAVIVNWGYGEDLYGNDPPEMRDEYVNAIRSATRTLSQQNNAQLIYTSDVWEQVHKEMPALKLYEDGNHPTANGSYLSALMIYGFLFGSDVSKVSFKPSDVDDGAARIIQTDVNRFYAS